MVTLTVGIASAGVPVSVPLSSTCPAASDDESTLSAVTAAIVTPAPVASGAIVSIVIGPSATGVLGLPATSL